MRQTILAMALLLFALSAQGESPHAAGGAVEGTMTNAKLRQDAMTGVQQVVSELGCAGVDSVRPYVTSMPQGEKGARVWHERWMVSCGSNRHTIDMRFNESGLDAADYLVTSAR